MSDRTAARVCSNELGAVNMASPLQLRLKIVASRFDFNINDVAGERAPARCTRCST